MQDEISTLKLKDKDRQAEVSRLLPQITKLQAKKWQFAQPSPVDKFVNILCQQAVASFTTYPFSKAISSAPKTSYSLLLASSSQLLLWVVDTSFPIPLSSFKWTSYRIRQQHNASGDEVVGSLDLAQSSSMNIGLIAREWCEWLPARHYVPVDPIWVWIQDPRWLSIFSSFFPTVSFVDGNVDLLPPVDILLLSKIMLSQCNLVLDQCPVSLLLSSSRLLSVKGWVYRFWRVNFFWWEDAQMEIGLYFLCICLPC